MTREEILAMEPGRELDALIEQHIFGKRVEWIQDEVTDPYPIVPAEYGYIVENYSSDISAAWEVVNQMYKDNWDFTLERHRFMNRDKVGAFFGSLETVKAEAAPEAICKAALLAILPGGGINP